MLGFAMSVPGAFALSIDTDVIPKLVFRRYKLTGFKRWNGVVM